MTRLSRIAVFGLALGFAVAAGTGCASQESKLRKAHEGIDNAPATAVAVEKAAGPGAYTVGELFAKGAALNGKKVTVRGKVVKMSAGIMDRNWIHLRDGSGDPAQRTHDLVVTSQDAPAVGDVVTATGTLAKDKDFGSGYRYAVILEQATVAK